MRSGVDHVVMKYTLSSAHYSGPLINGMAVKAYNIRSTIYISNAASF